MAALAPISSQSTARPTTTHHDAPPKYVEKLNKDGFVMRFLNPEYVQYMEKQRQPASTALDPARALPIICNTQQLAQFNEFAPAAPTRSAESMMKHVEETAEKVGLSPEGFKDDIDVLCTKYDIPIGMMDKLRCLAEFDRLEWIIDDSYSMTGPRWREAHGRIKVLLEILAHIPTAPIQISFLNRKDVITLSHEKETPERFIQRAHGEIDRLFRKSPNGGTPIWKNLVKSFKEGEGKMVARYLFCDGEPSGRSEEREAIQTLLNGREMPERNPITLLSCTEKTEEVEWMKEMEEAVAFCAECDDFEEEAREVQGDQGSVLPYTKGFYLVCQLVAAMNPDDLDALDESVPLTKSTLDELLGVVYSSGEYERYFVDFVQTQERRKVKTQLDYIKKQQNWGALYQQFSTATYAKDIKEVRQFKERLKKCVIDGDGERELAPPPYSR